jgi:hypothetical protein
VSNDDLFGAPAGWYPDPLGLPQLRWWNNHAWTEQTSAARQPMIVQDTKFAWAEDEQPTRREERERERNSGDRSPVDAVIPTAESLRELEPPRAFTQVSQGAPSTPAAAAPIYTPPVATPAMPEPQVAAPAAFTPPPAAQQPVAPQPVATAAPTPTPTPTPTVESLYQPDPIVPAAAKTPSLDDVFSAPRLTAADESLDALFGANKSRKTQTRVKTPIVTIDQVAPTTTASARISSAPAWIMALIPMLQLFSAVMLINVLGQYGSQLIFIGILVLPYFIVIALAYYDHKALVAAGLPQPAHWAWAFATAPAYLLVRARAVIRETGHGIGPVLVWFALAFLHVASILAVPGIIISLVPTVFTAQIEQSVESDAFLITGAMPDVTCPATPPVLPNDQLKCTSTSIEGKVSTVTVTMTRSNGWIDWQTINWGGPDMQTANLPASVPAPTDGDTDSATTDGTTTDTTDTTTTP